MAQDKISEKQAEYYGRRYEQYGCGVDAVASGNPRYKDVRYEKLSRVFFHDEAFSMHDVGFGLGHFYDYLQNMFPHKKIAYSGSEVTPHFVESCRERYPQCVFFNRDLSKEPFLEKYDYVVFGGTFYHLAGSSEKDFEKFVYRMIENGFHSSKRGIAFNFISSFVEYRYDYLFYGDMHNMIDFIRKRLSRFFLIDHSIPLYEFTVCVYHPEYIKSRYSDGDFRKYFKE